MPSFQVKRVQTLLFGVIEAANQSPWLGAFAGPGATTSIDLDDGALDLIADELELDAEGLAADASRYVGGLYRPKARGMGGSGGRARLVRSRRLASGDRALPHVEYWWGRRAVETDVAASEVAKQILGIGARLTGLQPRPPPTDWVVPLRGVDARVGDARLRLGWVSKGVTPGSSAWRRMLRPWWPFWFEPELWPSWPLLLLLGDPRVRLHVLPDGRARLRIARSAWFRG